MNRKRGITFAEVLIVVAVILVLAAVVWLALGPAIRKKTFEARVRNDLAQIVVAINIYRGDYDDSLPRSFDALPKDVPRKIKGYDWNRHRIYAPSLSYDQGRYFYTQPQIVQDFIRAGRIHARFDPDHHPIVTAEFFELQHMGKKWVEFRHHGPNGGTEKGLSFHCLGVRLNGSVGPVLSRDEYRHEFANCLSFHGFPKRI